MTHVLVHNSKSFYVNDNDNNNKPYMAWVMRPVMIRSIEALKIDIFEIRY